MTVFDISSVRDERSQRDRLSLDSDAEEQAQAQSGICCRLRDVGERTQ